MDPDAEHLTEHAVELVSAARRLADSVADPSTAIAAARGTRADRRGARRFDPRLRARASLARPRGRSARTVCRRFERAADGWPATYGSEGPSYERQAQLLSSLYEAGATLRLSRRACARANDLLIDMTAPTTLLRRCFMMRRSRPSAEPTACRLESHGVPPASRTCDRPGSPEEVLRHSHGPPTTSSTTVEGISSKRLSRSAASQDRPKPAVRSPQSSGVSTRRFRSSSWLRRRWNRPWRRGLGWPYRSCRRADAPWLREPSSGAVRCPYGRGSGSIAYESSTRATGSWVMKRDPNHRSLCAARRTNRPRSGQHARRRPRTRRQSGSSRRQGSRA